MKVRHLNKREVFSIGLAMLGVLLTLLGTVNQSFMLWIAMLFLAISILMFVLSQKPNLETYIVIIYVFVSIIGFTVSSPWDVFDKSYMTLMLLLIPGLLLLVGFIIRKPSTILQFIKNLPYSTSIISIALFHFLVIGILASGV